MFGGVSGGDAVDHQLSLLMRLCPVLYSNWNCTLRAVRLGLRQKAVGPG